MPEGTLAFANEPLLRVTAPRVDAQLLETILLNQIDFQTMVATKAARIVLAAGGGEPGAGASLFDFSARRTHGSDAAIKVARAAAVAGFGGTSNVAAAIRYGLPAVGTMAHSYVLSFESEEAAFRAFIEDNPDNALLLVDTYETAEGVRRAIEASRATGVPLAGVRIDSGDLLALSKEARRLLDEAGMEEARIVASGDLEEGRIAELVAAGAPIDLWGVGTDLGTSRDSPAINGVYKLVADRTEGEWRGVAKSSVGKADRPRRQAGLPELRRRRDGGRRDRGRRRGPGGRAAPGPGHAQRGDRPSPRRSRSCGSGPSASLGSLPPGLRRGGGEPYPVAYSAGLEAARRG